MKEKRSLYEMIFGKKVDAPQEGETQLKMLNGFTPFFTSFSGEAYNIDTVRTAVDAIARNGAKLKARHIRRTSAAIKNAGSGIEYMLQTRPNPQMDAYSFYYKVITQLYMENNAFIYIDRDSKGNVFGFQPLTPMTTEFIELDGDLLVRFFFMGGQVRKIPYKDLIHLRRFFYISDMYGDISDLALRPTLDLLNTTNQGIVNAIKSSAFIRGILKFVGMIKPEDKRRETAAFTKDYMGIDNNGGVAATDGKFEFIPISNDPKMINASQMQLIEDKVYKYFNVNKNIVMSDYTEQQWNSFYESVLEPLSIQMSLEFTDKLFSDGQKGFGNEIVFEANRLQYASSTTKIALVNTLIDRGLLSMNEAREIFNLGPIEDGDKRIVSLNFVDASKANQYQGVDGSG